MKTNGLVRGAACALALLLTPTLQCRAEGIADDYVSDVPSIADQIPIDSGNGVELASMMDDCTAVASDCCGDSCCEEKGCGDGCGAGGGLFGLAGDRQPFWFAGTEMTAMNINNRSGGIITASFSDTTAPGVSTFATVDGNGVNDVWGYGPRVWGGRQFGEKWGIVARYWTLSADVTNTPPAPNPNIPNTGTNFATIFEQDHTDMRTADVELVRSFRPGKWKVDATLGGRHAHINVRSNFLAFGVFTTGNFVNLTLQNGFYFDGEGGTSAINVRRQIGNSPVSFFGSFRGSYIGGHTTSFGRSDGTIASSPSAPLVGAATVTRARADAELDIFEYQIGLQVDHKLQRLPVNAFFRAAFEYQNWDIDAPPTGGAGFGGTIGEITTNSFASAGIGAAHLTGLALGTGFTY